jgi:hypothetical protein
MLAVCAVAGLLGLVPQLHHSVSRGVLRATSPLACAAEPSVEAASAEATSADEHASEWSGAAVWSKGFAEVWQ